MTRIYLSPHFDDAALSCGGLIWEQAQAGEKVAIWTVCAGEPPDANLSLYAQELHKRWNMDQNAPAQRRIEDINACRRLGASYQHLSIPDCIYRRDSKTGEFYYTSVKALKGPLHAGDRQTIDNLLHELQLSLPPDAELVCPLALGVHVDHQITRRVAERLERKLRYYADFPYVLRRTGKIARLEQEGWESQIFPISAEGLKAWQDSISAYASQISTFWSSELKMRQAVGKYLQTQGGIRLWARVAS